MDVLVGDKGDSIHKEHSVLEEKAYRDTWGNGFESLITMMYERLHIMNDLLSSKGVIFIHADYRAISQFKLICDEIFGQENLVNELIWAYRTAGNSKEFWARKHDNILFYQKSNKRKFNLIKEKSYHLKKYDYGDHYEDSI